MVCRQKLYFTSTSPTCQASSTREAGFTLVEMLVTMAIIGVLAALGVKAYDAYKENAYNAMADGAFTQARAALEAGKIDSESFPDGVLVSTTVGPGIPSGDEAELILPGFVIPRDVRVHVTHTTNCVSGLCVQDFIHVRHCRSNRAISYSYLPNFGQILNRNLAVDPGCGDAA